MAASMAAEVGLNFTETENAAGLETLTVGYAGATISGVADDWLVTLPGLTHNGRTVLVWAERPGETGYNVLSFLEGRTWRFKSETAFVTWSGCVNFSGSTALPLGVSCGFATGNGNTYFANVFETTAAAPEPATWGMMGIGFAGLALAGWRPRKPVNAIV